MNYFGVFAIDSYHLVGGHFPSVHVTNTYEDVDDVIGQMMREAEAYKIENANHVRITRTDLINAVQNAKYGRATIHFDYPREGVIIINWND